MVTLYLTTEEFPQWLCYFMAPLVMYRSSFPTSSPTLIFPLKKIVAPSRQYEVVYHCGCILYFPSTYWMLDAFPSFLGIFFFLTRIYSLLLQLHFFSFLLFSCKYLCILDTRLLTQRVCSQFGVGKNKADLNTMFLIHSLCHPFQGGTS